MSYSDLARTRLSRLPVLFQTAGLQVRAITSSPGVEPRTYGDWLNLIGFFNETTRAQDFESTTELRALKRTGKLLVQDSVTLLEGSQIRVPIGSPSTYQTWQVCAQGQPHENQVGTTLYVVERTENLQAGSSRGGGR